MPEQHAQLMFVWIGHRPIPTVHRNPDAVRFRVAASGFVSFLVRPAACLTAEAARGECNELYLFTDGVFPPLDKTMAMSAVRGYGFCVTGDCAVCDECHIFAAGLEMYLPASFRAR